MSGTPEPADRRQTVLPLTAPCREKIEAMTDTDADLHSNGVARMFPALGGTGATRHVAELLESRSLAAASAG